jgi:Arc/MetJ-type ribon-helix-helix transcriptional regulator
MMTVRLPEEIEREVARIASTENRTKTDVVREALAEYIGHRAARKSAYELGADLFGVYGSGEESRSQTYKQRLKERLHAKHAR